MRRWRACTIALVFVGGIAACATRKPDEPSTAAAEAAQAAHEGAAQATEAKPRRPSTYRLQIGDEMDVTFYKTPELNTHVKIRPDGQITLPFIGDVRALDVEPSQLSSMLEERYTGELRVPRITVNVTTFGGQRAYVGGEVEQPGMIPLVGPITALQAIQQAGGFRETASLRSVILIRRKGGQVIGTEVDLSEVVSGDHPEEDPLLQAYDIVYVPRTYIADVDIFVDQYIRKIMPMNPSLGIGLGAF